MRLTRLDLVIALVLAGGSVAAFAPAFSADFIGLDDPIYVRFNHHVTRGLNAEDIKWAWGTSFYASNWHPLTWMSLQLDATLFGDEAAGFHVVNIALHAVSAVLLFLTLRSMTGAVWRSGIVAALFAWHPLRVESVVWIAERKDVLSIFFGLLALWVYGSYVQRRTVWRYAGVATLFTLSLLAKPTLVTLPCLLLVLDWWPLRRAGAEATKPAPTVQGAKARKDTVSRATAVWLSLALEKLPLLAIAFASCVLTYQAQQAGGSVRSIEAMGIGSRLLNSIVAYVTYIGMAIWPIDLAPIYPYPKQGWPEWRIAISVIVLVAFTGLAVWQRRKRPYLLAGWLWYLGTLVPVIGIVQVGNQAYADRYTYFPMIGLCLALVWTVAEAVPASAVRPAFGFAGLVAVLLALLSMRQTTFWHDDLAMWPHVLTVTGPNTHAYNSYGVALENRDREQGREPEDAIKYYRLAVETEPGNGTAHYNLGRALKNQGEGSRNQRELDGAIEQFRIAIGCDPNLPSAQNDWGAILIGQHKYREAEEHIRAAIAVNNRLGAFTKDSALYEFNLAYVLDKQGRMGEAIEQYRRTLHMNPLDLSTLTQLGLCLGRAGEHSAAVTYLRRAAELKHDSPGVWRNLGVSLENCNRRAEAIACFRQAVKLESKNLASRLRLATALAADGKTSEAEAQFHIIDEMDPGWRESVRKQAWIFATAPAQPGRDRETAVWAAETACRAVPQPPPADYLDTLAAAYADAGRFAEAIAMAEKAFTAAEAEKNSDLAKAIAERLAIYRQNKPYHEPTPTVPKP
jgi:tetratricopeptide (TPR) repeat protein